MRSEVSLCEFILFYVKVFFNRIDVFRDLRKKKFEKQILQSMLLKYVM